MRRILVTGVLLAAASLPAFAVNFSGKWAMQRRTTGEENGTSVVLTLNQVGQKVTGSTNTAMEMWDNSPVNNGIWGGKLEGDTLSFYLWNGSDQPARMRYCGTMSPSGEEIVFTISPVRGESNGSGCASQPATTGAPGAGARLPRQVTAHRVK